MWLFGGYGYDAKGGGGQLGLVDIGGDGYLSDLWKFDGNNWTWVSGSNTKN
jgi:hypothetical protein